MTPGEGDAESSKGQPISPQVHPCVSHCPCPRFPHVDAFTSGAQVSSTDLSKKMQQFGSVCGDHTLWAVETEPEV